MWLIQDVDVSFFFILFYFANTTPQTWGLTSNYCTGRVCSLPVTPRTPQGGGSPSVLLTLYKAGGACFPRLDFFLMVFFFMFNFNIKKSLISVKILRLLKQMSFIQREGLYNSSIPIQGDTTVPLQKLGKKMKKKLQNQRILFVYNGSLCMVSGKSVTCIFFRSLNLLTWIATNQARTSEYAGLVLVLLNLYHPQGMSKHMQEATANTGKRCSLSWNTSWSLHAFPLIRLSWLSPAQ